MTPPTMISRTTSSRLRMPSSMTSCVTCALTVLLLAGPTLTSARSHHQVFYQQSPGLPESSLPNLGASDGGSRSGRLMVLLNMRDSVNHLLQAPDSSNIRGAGLDGSEVSNVDAEGHDSDLTGKGEIQPAADKRIFCNGFTGCGGRFREQRRRGQTTRHNNEKRVFCNSHGCSSRGRKRAIASRADSGEDKSSSNGSSTRLDMSLWLEAMRRISEFQHLRSPQRTVCPGPLCPTNARLPGLGSSAARPDSPSSPGAEDDELLSDLVVSSGKRFFAGQSDAEWDAINDALR